MDENLEGGMALRLNPINPEPERIFKALPVGYKYGSIHGGIEICGGGIAESAINPTVIEMQKEIATDIAPFADVYWAPRFKVWCHGEVLEDQDTAQLLLPGNPQKSFYIRRPAILISTSKPVLNLNEITKAAHSVAFRMVLTEMVQHFTSEFIFGLAESQSADRMRSWEHAVEKLMLHWMGFVEARLSLKDTKKKQTTDNAFRTPLGETMEKIWYGDMAAHLSRVNSYAERAIDLDAMLPPKLPQIAMAG